MRAGWPTILGLLLVATLATWVTASAEDLYWDDADKESEFLEVKDESYLNRVKRDWNLFELPTFQNPFWPETTTTTPAPENYESATEDQGPLDNDDETHSDGSGAAPIPAFNGDPREKTLRVTFVVMEPYQDEYSNRDSEMFQTFSHSLADAVNKLFEGLHGTQKASLIRIQSRPADNFSCKVTLDIVTTADNTDQIADLLRVHIRNTRSLGNYTVMLEDFSANVVMPGSPFEQCSSDRIQCSDGRCVNGDARCDGFRDCSDGEDEYNCPVDEDQNQNQVDESIGAPCERTFRCPGSEITLCTEDTCNGINDCPEGEDEDPNMCASESGDFPTTRKGIINEDEESTNPNYNNVPGQDEYGETGNRISDDDELSTPAYESACRSEEFRCDETRCILRSQVCDRTPDCNDGTDESSCPPEQCGRDDFRCNNNQCIEGSKRCDRIFDCPGREDEIGCDCTEDEFRCLSDGICIEGRKKCDNTSNCRDGSDELNCETCQDFTCPAGSRVQCAIRCDDEPECEGGEDEESCSDDECAHECDGVCLDATKICNNIADCSDRSDELNCDHCDGPEDFRCDNLQCIKLVERCNGVIECDDESDEQHCNDTVTATRTDKCQDGEFICRSGVCLNPAFVCDNRQDCDDGSDEADCGHFNGDTTPSVFTTSNRGYNPYAPRTDRPRSDDITTYQPYVPVTTASPYDNEVDEYSTPSPSPRYPDRGEDDRYRPDQGQPDDTDENDINGYATRSPAPPRNPEDDFYEHRTRSPATSPPRYPGYDINGYPTRSPATSPPRNPGYDINGYPTRRPATSPPRYPGYDINGYPTRSPATSPPRNPEDDIYEYPTRSPATPPPRYPENDIYDYPTRSPETSPPRNPENGVYGYPTRNPATSPPRNPGPVTLDLKTYPSEQEVRFGGDVVFICRDEGPERAPVRWIRERGRPLKPGSSDKKGRLEMFQVTSADAGVYICQAPRYLGTPGSQVRVTLNVEVPQRIPTRSPYVACKPYEATCSNGECVPKSAVCDGKPDCSDNSDEDMCNYNGQCEPNQFQCQNRKCVLKSWLCDSDDDCGDGSDERGCPEADPDSACLPMEFACHNNSQCIRKSFHCDGQANDCIDGSDELGCSQVYISKPPKPANVRLNGGDTLDLTCEAVGVPVPIVSWRLNWGHVPAKCVSTNANGVGRLVCPDMRPEDSGAYSCEAINNKGTTFASPDSIVFVGQNNPCPEGFFNSEAQSAQDCIRCFCFGRATRCRSADLFTYNMPTALGEGGTRLLGVALSGDGKVRTDQSIINHYYFQAMRNGATVTKLESRDPNWLGNYHPYLTLPESYNGNQLTSYGGHIRYTVLAHAYSVSDDVPAIIVEGKYATLYHVPGSEGFAPTYQINARFVPEYWLKADSNGELIPATREDIMMALDDVKMILLRADNNNAGVNITDFMMESAQSINSDHGAASLVEECTCPVGYEGLSCQKCKAGYIREMSGPWLGECVRRACPPGTYGDPASGDACKPCPCPLTNKENQFATTCSLRPDGSVACDCFPGYEGKNCEKCSPGFEGNPLVYGNTCQVRPTHNCNPLGTRHEQLLDECVCKDNVQGTYCDQCKNDSFYLSNDFRHGCARCFCSGESQSCMSSNLRRKTTSISFNVPSIVDDVRVYNTQPQSYSNLKYTVPVETELRPSLTRGGLGLSGIDRSKPTVYYWSMPRSFSGDKVTSYGGYLRYTLDNVPSYVETSLKNKAADVQLISDNHLIFQYFGEFKPSYEGVLNVSVQLLEKGWQRSDGQEVPREHFLLALADVKTILIKATYSTDSIATPLYASIDTAADDGDGPAALHVEQCVCPIGYVGTSCEDCAPGYTRGEGGLYLSHCEECQCNGHSKNCHPENGMCFNCQDNTDGYQCELCKEGYERDGYDKCIPIEGSDQTSSAKPCRCDPRGEEEPCEDGQCTCKRNVDGENCDQCRAGTFGLSFENPEGCIECYCSGATTECQEAKHYYRSAWPAPIIGDNYGGYTIMNIDASLVINENFVPVPDKSELMYIFPFPAQEDLYWSLPKFPGNSILSYGGKLYLRQEFQSNDESVQTSESGNDVVLAADDISISWYNPDTLRSGESKSFQIPLQEQGWTVMNSGQAVTRATFMRVLKNLKRILVKATLAQNIVSTSISDVSIDTATNVYQPNSQIAQKIEVCSCPPGHLGTSCETCAAGYYKDRQEYCSPCPCNGHDCQLDTYGEVVCNCRPPFTGPDCSAKGDSQTQGTTNRPPLGQSTVTVKITSDKIAIREIGSSINFTCEARSTYTRRLLKEWTKEDGELPQGRYITNPYTGVLTITNLQITDSGVYICQSSDGQSTQQEYATLRVPANELVIPTVEIRPQAVNDFFAGERIELQCVTTGSPKPTISWQRGSNRALPLSVQTYENILIIENAREEDAGEYRCIAYNVLGRTDGTAVVNIRSRPSRPKVDNLIVSPIAPSVNEGQTIRVVCTGSTNVRAGSLDWIRQDGDRFQENVRSDNGVLYVEEARPENAGVYICQTDSSDVAPQSVVVTVVSTAPPSPDDAPEVTVPVASLTLPSGGSNKVDCFAKGKPLPIIKWTKHEGSFGHGVSQRGDSLIINEALVSDSGYYLCQGLDPYDNHVLSNVYLYVEVERRETPVVEVWPPGESPVALGDTNFEFHCRVSGIPQPDVTWSRAYGRALSSHAQIIPNNILKFDKIEVNDEGEYICTGDNIVGSASASAVLKVRSPPEIVITPQNDMVVAFQDPVSVDCRAEGYPEPTVSIRGPNNQLIATGQHIASLRIPSAGASDEGEYSCLASNPAGNNEERFLIRVEERGDGADFGGSGDYNIDPNGQRDPNNQNPSFSYPTNPDENPYYPNPPPRPRPNNPTIPLERNVFVGTDLSIHCNISDTSTAQWDRADKQPFQNNVEQVDQMLYIRNVTKANAGVYICTAYNYGSSERALYTNIKVVYRPTITLRPQSQVVSPGSSPVVECVVHGDDIIQIEWRPIDKPFSNRVVVRNTTLIFQQIEIEDAGNYECIAKSRHAASNATAEVRVMEESDVGFESHEHDQWVKAGSGVVLSCNISTKGVTVSWMKDGRWPPASVRTRPDGSLYIKIAKPYHSGQYICHISDSYGRQTSNYINLHIEGVPTKALVRIDQPRRAFRAGENVKVLCRSISDDVTAEWIKRDEHGNLQFVEFSTYGGGSMLKINSVSENDAGVYQCTGRTRRGQNFTDILNLEVEPGTALTDPREPNNPVQEFYARLRSAVDMPCNHDMDGDITVHWKREYTPLSSDVTTNQPVLHIPSVSEEDAGIYVCRVSNSRHAVETKAILHVTGIVPQFDGNAWLALPTLKDAYRKFDIEISFKPTEPSGLILYNSQDPNGSTDYIALVIDEGYPEFYLNCGTGPVSVKGNSPLTLNEWHTIRLNKIGSRITMDVDNDGPFIENMDENKNWLLELRDPLYIGSVPELRSLPRDLAYYRGFHGCVSMLILGHEEKNLMVELLNAQGLKNCDTCQGNLCENQGVCQESRTERGYTCLCPSEFSGLNCERRGEGCRPGICGPGRCSNTATGYKCACPVTHTGANCEKSQQIEYPAFTGSAYVALKPPNTARILKLSMKIKAMEPVSDGIIMYCAESPRGIGGYTSLAVRDKKLEFQYDQGDGNPVILVSNTTLPADEWTDVQVTRSGPTVSLVVNLVHNYEKRLSYPSYRFKELKLETPMFVGGVDDSIVVNSNTGISSGFMGCIKDLKTHGGSVDIVNDPVASANLQECSRPRGDIQEADYNPCHCRNGGSCASDGSCNCPSGFSGYYCEKRTASSLRHPPRSSSDPCLARPCRNGGTCRIDYSTNNLMNHTCDCPLGYSGASCQMALELANSVGFNGNGYVELPANLVRYDDPENDPAVIMLRTMTTKDGILVYQHEALSGTEGDFIMIRIENGYVVLEWNLGSGITSIKVEGEDRLGFVGDGDMHTIVVRVISDGRMELTVDGHMQRGFSNGLSSRLGVDSNIYIGGIPERLNPYGYPGLTGCIDQVEFMYAARGVNLGQTAVTARNTQPCNYGR